MNAPIHPLYEGSLEAAKAVRALFLELSEPIRTLSAPFTRALDPLTTDAAVGIYHDRIRRSVIEACEAKPGGVNSPYRWLRLASLATRDPRWGQLADAAIAIRRGGTMSREAACTWSGMSDRSARREFGVGDVKGADLYRWAKA